MAWGKVSAREFKRGKIGGSLLCPQEQASVAASGPGDVHGMTELKGNGAINSVAQ